ncbi:MAG: DUF4129 domain-containing protein [Oligoflexales bacterium]|nr:DUF4129 domain-containing protein [Oligoflexales bacterium]
MIIIFWSSKEEAWLRYDPVQTVAPERISLGASPFVLQEEIGYFTKSKETLQFLANAIATEISLVYLGKRFSYFTIFSFVIFIFIVLLFFVHIMNKKEKYKVKKIYLKFNKMMAKKGLRRSANEGPETFGEKCLAKLPEQAFLVRRFIQLYLELSYSSQEIPASKVKEMSKILRNLNT